MYYRDQLTVSCVFMKLSIKADFFDNLSHNFVWKFINNPFFRIKNNI